MLLEFRAGNFLSFDVQQSIRTATPSIGDGTSYGGCSRTMTVYGPNASGKSNLVRAVGIARNLALNRAVKTRGLRYGEYRGMARERNSHLEFVMRTGGDTLAYGFETDLGTGAVSEEWLYRLSPDGDVPVYEIGSDRTTACGSRTALADIAADGCVEASEVMGWLSDSLVVVSGRDPKVSVPVRDDFVESLGRDLERLDTGIGDVETIRDMAFAPSNPSRRHDVMVTDIRSGTATMVHPDGSASELGFVHEHGHVSGLRGESHGTARLVMLLSLMSVPSGERTAVVDDLDMSLHMLAAREVLSMSGKSEGLQILCTVSETDLIRCGLVGREGMAVMDMLGDRGRRGSRIRMVSDYGDMAGNVFDDYADGRYGSLPIFSDPVLE